MVNDKYQGVNADCEQSIQRIKQKKKLKAADFKTAKDIENLLFSLNDDQIEEIIGFLPDPARIQLDYSVLRDIIKHLMNLPLQKPQDSSNIYPDWEEKIVFNGLSDLESHYLNDGFLQIGSLDAYLNNESNFFSEEVKDKIQQVYTDKKSACSGGDLFWEMVTAISPKQTSPYQSAVIILMAKYFESCDIFEEPK